MVRILVSGQKTNHSGGPSFKVDDWSRLRRFLIIGTTGGTYYQSEREITEECLELVDRCIEQEATRVVKLVIEVSTQGLAYKQQATLTTLARLIQSKDGKARALIASEIRTLVRTGTQLFMLVDVLNKTGGWGRYKRSLIASWYTTADSRGLAYQLTKYPSRVVVEKETPWTHRDVLRHCHAYASSDELNALLAYAAGRTSASDTSLSIMTLNGSVKSVVEAKDGAGVEYLLAVEQAKACTSVESLLGLIRQYSMPWEVIPTQFLSEVPVCEALLESMGLEATLRSLAKFTANGTLAAGSPGLSTVLKRLSDESIITQSRVHPITILKALCTYSAGRGERSSLTWVPNQELIRVLDSAFYLSFKSVVPTNKSIKLCLDVSGSMGWTNAAPNLSCAKLAAALALVTLSVEPSARVMAFSNTPVALDIHPGMRLDQVMALTDSVNFGGTDCSIPMRTTPSDELVDAFVVVTDSETNAGAGSAAKELVKYRERAGVPESKLIVVGLTATNCSIADPNDPYMLDIAGFSPETPKLISEFISGRV